jgi:hypothetical protein
VGELLLVDLEGLRALGRTLADTATLTMPGSPITPASGQSTTTTADAYTRIASNINEMAATCVWNATSYEDVDETLRNQLQRYDAGVPK